MTLLLFGDPQVFAIEAILEPGPEFGQVGSGHVAGRVRVWLSGLHIGDFDEPYCYLRPIQEHFRELGESVERLWHPAMEGLDSSSIFDLLDFAHCCAHRHRCLDQSPGWDWSAYDARMAELADLPGCDFTSVDECFDDWKSFIVAPPGGDLLVLSLSHDSDSVECSRFPVRAFREVVAQFGDWLSVQESRLLPPPA